MVYVVRFLTLVSERNICCNKSYNFHPCDCKCPIGGYFIFEKMLISLLVAITKVSPL